MKYIYKKNNINAIVKYNKLYIIFKKKLSFNTTYLFYNA